MSDVSNIVATLPADHLQRAAMIDCFRQAMRELAGGVAVVTVGQGSDRIHLNLSGIAVRRTSPAAPVWKRDLVIMEAAAKVALFRRKILRVDHRVLADQFAGCSGFQGEDRYGGGKWVTLSTDGLAILEDTLAGADWRR